MIMGRDNDALKAEMINAINEGGAWFTTRENCYIKIGKSEAGELLYARVCILKDGALTGGAYSFGTDWFDISFHGRLIDIFADPDSLKYYDMRHDDEQGTYLNTDDGPVHEGSSLIEFCRKADEEVLAGNVRGFMIDGTGFAKELPPSEKKMGRTKDIFSIIQ